MKGPSEAKSLQEEDQQEIFEQQTWIPAISREKLINNCNPEILEEITRLIISVQNSITHLKGLIKNQNYYMAFCSFGDIYTLPEKLATYRNHNGENQISHINPILFSKEYLAQIKQTPPSINNPKISLEENRKNYMPFLKLINTETIN
ncbi:MAG: hypothetical protein UR27_C0005G0025 [Candidatus Peregrinibacteria bacterium GW2011_GWA2_33_10]|nr:MAG: hypothetical protein UR27_C0005G0025 [Candidatus Peregrinibacteria bacterium GW2011_GWA2_33_10]KKP39283.1 MAG: hypothetical protein UR30_C0011G0026 [Candidatus Peregrinibacteria bacterium GW2011_GWC2_33_13]